MQAALVEAAIERFRFWAVFAITSHVLCSYYAGDTRPHFGPPVCVASCEVYTKFVPTLYADPKESGVWPA